MANIAHFSVVSISNPIVNLPQHTTPGGMSTCQNQPHKQCKLTESGFFVDLFFLGCFLGPFFCFMKPRPSLIYPVGDTKTLFFLFWPRANFLLVLGKKKKSWVTLQGRAAAYRQ